MKKILILLFILPFFAKAQVPTLHPDSTYTDKGHKTGVLVVTNKFYLAPKANVDTLMFAQFDQFGQLVMRKIPITDSQYLRRDIDLNTISILQRLLIGDTVNIRLRPIAGTNTTITGTYPNLTFNSIRPIYQQTAIPFANSSGNLTSDSTKLTYGGEYINIAPISAAGRSGIFLNQGRAEMYAQFGGLTFNIGSGTAIGTYDASKTYTFQNRGNTYLQMGTTAITGGVNNATFSANVSAQSITSTSTINTAGYTVATLPAGTVGMRAYVTDGASVTYLGTAIGGGTTVVSVLKNATGWVYD